MHRSGGEGRYFLFVVFCFVLKLSYFCRRTQELEAWGKYSL